MMESAPLMKSLIYPSLGSLTRMDILFLSLLNSMLRKTSKLWVPLIDLVLQLMLT